MTGTLDVIVLGAGMAGASLAAELAPRCRVLLLELEDQPGRHATGRSAAMFFESYGNATVRALTRASRAFLEHPPQGFTDAPLLSPRSALFVADAPRRHLLDAMLGAADAPPSLQRVDTESAGRLCPILRRDWLAAAAVDDTGHDMDVAAIHQGYLRRARQAGAAVVLGAFELTIRRAGTQWRVASRAGTFQANVLVNATGAWADQVARQAGARPVGLQPMRRTAMLLPAPAGHDIRRWPLVVDIDEQFYFKPDAGQLLLSPANEDPMDPCDVAPEELDVAIAVDRFEAATTMQVTRLTHRWAGLRSFVADRSPVAGFDPRAEGFFWLAGQGGYGIQMAPALARAAAALVMRQPLPDDLLASGVTAGNLSPARAALANRRDAAP
ncbi:D-arginine dehydrogenase [Burkholderiaceae bacterium]|nr:D-arginine dehydrogenase [Burkholderiaceae bacterium]